MDSLPTFGPFQLERPLARGGMAVVWRAVHTHHDHPVAVKVMTAEHARKPRFVESFQREVRAVARLNHPNIVRVFDYGEVSEQIAEASDGHLVAQSPYMVMELAGSTLSRIDRDELTWPHVHTILVHILDALAHAHARKLVHRDLKPDNVLFLSADDGGQLKLSDFGVAYAMNTTRRLRAEDEVITGTPKFMAPEQIRGQLRDQGPWTDLYALGCLVYWLTTGEPLFSANSVDELLRRHLDDARPPLEPRVEAPEGFGSWARRLVARNPADRFQRTADAAVALNELYERHPLDEMTIPAAGPEGESVELTVVDAPDPTRLWSEARADSPSESREQSPADDRRDGAVPDLPDTWRDPDRTDDSLEMSGVGLGLFELREIPVVGRHSHRDLLWNHLDDAIHTRRPHAVILEGPAGIGKTRLAKWLAHRAHEVGAVSTLTARHSPIGGPADGLSRMFADHLRCTGLTREVILERLRGFYAADRGLEPQDLHQCVALTDLIAPGADPDFDEHQQAIRFSSSEQRHLVWKRLLSKLVDHRPLLLVLDDVHRGLETLQFVDFLLEQGADDSLEVLMVMTVRPALRDDDPLVGDVLCHIEDRPCVRKLNVEPLPESDHLRLVRRLLKLEPQLASRVADRTAGNPLFAVQLVGDWVEEGLLEFGERGFRLATDERPGLPEDVEGLLRRRIEHIVGQPLDESAPPALRALELAAALGGDVDRQEWTQACRVADIDPPPQLLRDLSAQSLVVVHEHGWSFAHGALAETLETVAAEHGRLKQHHRHCAQMLHRLYDTSQPALAPRLADHLLAAGEHEQALEPLEDAIEYHRRIGDLERSRRFFERHQSACDKLNLAPGARARIQGITRAIQSYLDGWQLQRAEEMIDRCEPICRANHYSDLLAKILWHRSRLVRKDSQFEEAIELGEAALDWFRQSGDREGTCWCLISLCWAHYRCSEYREVLQLCDHAERHARALDDPYLLTAVHSWRGPALFELDDYDGARDCLGRALELSEDNGFVTMQANCHNNLGEIDRKAGDLEPAARHYRKAIELRRRVATGGWQAHRLNIGLVRLQQRRFTEALPVLNTTLQEATEAGDDARTGLAHGALAACKAALGRWTEFDDHLHETADLVETSYGEWDMATVLQLAGDLARDDGQPRRAHRAWELAVDQWRTIGDDERAAELAENLQRLAKAEEG